MNCVDVHTQAELDDAIAGGDCAHCVGDGDFEAFDSATVEASGSATVRASDSAYGVEVVEGVATLFKAVEDDWRGSRKTSVSYEPGSTPEAPDWDGGKNECGGGLHFSPRPFMALAFCPDASRFVACPVRLSDVVVHKNPSYPEKVKARGVCAPVYEVDIDGERVATEVAA